MTESASWLPRAARLDRLPGTREHGRLVVGSGLGWTLDAMDVGLISFVMAALAVQRGLPERRGETLEAVDVEAVKAVAAPAG